MPADLSGASARPSLFGLLVVACLDAFPPLRPPLWRWWYDTLARRDSEGELLFMNFGFADLQDEGARLALDPADEPFRYPIQL